MRKPFVLGKLTFTSAQIMLLDNARPSAPTLLEALLKSGRSPAPETDPVEIASTIH
jgi:hypothetical protein